MSPSRTSYCPPLIGSSELCAEDVYGKANDSPRQASAINIANQLPKAMAFEIGSQLPAAVEDNRRRLFRQLRPGLVCDLAIRLKPWFALEVLECGFRVIAADRLHILRIRASGFASNLYPTNHFASPDAVPTRRPLTIHSCHGTRFVNGPLYRDSPSPIRLNESRA